jgi:NitT/TauT family transport system ATP-binding protein
VLGIELRRSRLLGKLFGGRRREAVARAQRLLESVGLAGARDRYPSQLSGGMQQRLSIAQSMICEPGILLLDEPFGALDPGITTDMHKLILELWSQTAMTVFMITHDIKEGFHLGTRLLVFDKVRHDPQAPDVYGARITYDIPLRRRASVARPRLALAS